MRQKTWRLSERLIAAINAVYARLGYPNREIRSISEFLRDLVIPKGLDQVEREAEARKQRRRPRPGPPPLRATAAVGTAGTAARFHPSLRASTSPPFYV